ncbi:YbjQ family protein, partial [Acidipropionibacterium jensenii]|uniref:YbjQ family protein n=1 Tax=Acidipropionibacterium jensenii TaxID=1749 RepID=UPI00264714A5
RSRSTTQAPAVPVPPMPLPEPVPITAGFPRHDIPVLTLDSFPGRQISGVLGAVEGCVTRSRELSPRADLSDILAVTRQDAVDAMVALALRVGADAVLGLRFDTSTISDGASEVCAYGTAVTLAP